MGMWSKGVAVFCAALFVVAGCGGGGDDSADGTSGPIVNEEAPANTAGGDTNSLISRISNGATAQTQTSFWRCRVDGLTVYNSFIADGTGYSIGVSAPVSDATIEWSVVDDKTASFNFGGESFTMFDIEFSLMSDGDFFSAEDSRGFDVDCSKRSTPPNTAPLLDRLSNGEDLENAGTIWHCNGRSLFYSFYASGSGDYESDFNSMGPIKFDWFVIDETSVSVMTSGESYTLNNIKSDGIRFTASDSRGGSLACYRFAFS
jgi:hypothetical protein